MDVRHDPACLTGPGGVLFGRDPEATHPGPPRRRVEVVQLDQQIPGRRPSEVARLDTIEPVPDNHLVNFGRLHSVVRLEHGLDDSLQAGLVGVTQLDHQAEVVLAVR